MLQPEEERPQFTGAIVPHPFRNHQVDENDEDLSGDSDISFSESSDEESGEESDDELPDDDTWSRNLRNVHVNNFEKDTGPTNILPPEATADRFFYQLTVP